MQSSEQKLQQNLASTDPTGAKALFAGSARQYATLEQQMRQDTGSKTRGFSGTYPPYLDSLQGSVKFLQQNPSLLGSNPSPQMQANLTGANTQLQALQAKMGDADAVKTFLQQRKQQIGDYLAQHNMTTGPLSKIYGGMNQQVY